LLGDLARAAHDVFPVIAPRLDHASQDLLEARHPVARLIRKIGARVKRLSVWREKDRHGPAATTGHRIDGLHVDAVDIGTLLAIDLHVDEVRVHLFGRHLVFERLVRHHVAPVTSRVADAEQNRFVLFFREPHRLLAPWIPIDRVVDVLKQIGAGLVLEMIGHTVRSFWGSCRSGQRGSTGHSRALGCREQEA